jgi:Flp pilus assembly pilin Flp
MWPEGCMGLPMLKRFVHLAKDARGVTAVEYALIGALVALGIAAALSGMATLLNAMFLAIEAVLGGA